VVEQSIEVFEGVYEELLIGTPAQAAAQRLGRAWFRPRYENLERAASPDELLLRRALLRFLAVVAEDEALRAELRPQAERYVGLSGEPDPGAVDPNLLETALTVGVQESGRAFIDRLAALLARTKDPAVRSAAAGALGRTEDPEARQALLADVLEERFPVQAGLQIVLRQLNRPSSREATFAWLEANAAEVFELVPGTFRSNVAGLGDVFCSREKAGAWEALVERHADLLPGYERSLAQALESIRLCAGLKAARGSELAKAVRELPVR
jgi:alanyl aminopeptidase